MSKKKLKFVPATNFAFHFYASSAGMWRNDYNLETLIAAMKKDDLPFNLWLVPMPLEADYEINFYAPKVEGATFLGHYSREGE